MSQRPIAIANLHPRLRIDRRAVVRVIRILDRNQPILAVRGSAMPDAGELSLVFLTDRALAALHAEFLNDPAPTDVITFPFSDRAPCGPVGEICLSADAAVRQIGSRPAAKRDFSSELTLYLVHGWLHLAGHDDRQPASKRAMRRAEARAMKLLRAGRAVPAFKI